MKISMIINPSSGQQNSLKDLDTIHKELSKHHIVSRFYTEKQYDAEIFASQAIDKDQDLIIVAGGDGTVNEIACAVGKAGRSVPVAIYPAGTSNDLASYLKIPKKAKDFLKLIEDFNILEMDLGKLNDQYFLNVAAIGNIADVASSADDDIKTKLGSLAYFFDAVGRLPELFNEVPKLSVTNDNISYKVEPVLVLIANSQRVGGFNNICPKARLDDGKLDVLIIKKSSLAEMAELVIKIIAGTHLTDPNILYFQTASLEIRTETEDMVLNLDGDNIAPEPSLHIECLKGQFKVLVKN